MKKLLIAAAALPLALSFAPVAHADELFDICPSGHDGVLGGVTSCAFADNVRRATSSAAAGLSRRIRRPPGRSTPCTAVNCGAIRRHLCGLMRPTNPGDSATGTATLTAFASPTTALGTACSSAAIPTVNPF